ncbi:uncharacterized protein LOC135503579 [Lineus longissimus]|uniref:uncharacterized protein LOC135503579 n=1 Tax=Lineus longissimus TaxID=88925 RepID=UPI00315C8EE2
MALPKTSMMTFSGDPRQFWMFMRRFNSCIGDTTVDDSAKLNCLFELCKGKAAAVIQPCAIMDPRKGYIRALELLKERFGNEYQISEACVKHVTEGPVIKGTDSTALQDLADEVSSCSETLQAMNCIGEIDTRSRVVQIVERLPLFLKSRWRKLAVDKVVKDKVYPGIQELVNFLQRVAREANDPVFGVTKPSEQDCSKKDGRTAGGKPQDYVQWKARSHTTGEAKNLAKANMKCYICESTHRLLDCPVWKSAAVPRRWSLAKEKRLCYRCLAGNHMGKNCPRGNTCNVNGCGKSHHFHLHEDRPSPKSKADPANNANSSFGTSDFQPNVPIQVVLRTVPVWLVGPGGKRVLINALLDEGSDTSYVRADVVTALGISGTKENLKIASIADCVSLDSQKVEVQLESIDGSTVRKMKIWTMSDMCRKLPIQNWNHHKTKFDHIADLEFPTASGRKTVDVLIGSDYPELGIALEERIGKPGEPVARRTPLGWTCVGPLPLINVHQTTTNFTMSFHATHESTDQQLQKLWDQDVIGEVHEDIYTPEDKMVIEKTKSSIRKLPDRFEVGIPWREDPPDLKYNRIVAERRLRSLEASLMRRPEVAKRYKEAFEATVEKGYITKISSEKAQEPGWYLPHFAVIRDDKQTTKVRIVYDAAAAYEGTSLNQKMFPGPKLQRDILEILLKFRLKPVALIGDIKEMFNQVSMAEKDRKFHRLLWRHLDPTAPIEVYEASRLVFGDAASPFLAQFVTKHQAEAMREQYPEAAEVVLKAIYIVDVIDSLEDDDEARRMRQDLQAVLKPAGFTIRRWCSNRLAVLEGLDESEQASGVNLEESVLPSVKTLGVEWDAASDTFTFILSSTEQTITTKRQILSRNATIFDLFQFLAPVVIRGKIALQECWLRGIGWDDDLPDDIQTRLDQWIGELQRVNEIHIPRCYRNRPVEDIVKMALHTFTDASRLAYGAVAYLRYQYTDGEIGISMVAAKFKVAPLKNVSIPGSS